MRKFSSETRERQLRANILIVAVWNYPSYLELGDHTSKEWEANVWSFYYNQIIFKTAKWKRENNFAIIIISVTVFIIIIDRATT